MGRTEDQLEKFDLEGLDINDLYRVLLRGKGALKASFSEIKEFESDLYLTLTDPECEGTITMDEVSEMAEWLSGYFDELLIRIHDRIGKIRSLLRRRLKDQAAQASREQELEILRALEDKLKSAASAVRDSAPRPKSESVNDPRMEALEKYVALQEQLGRPPSRSEIETGVGGGTKARAVSKAVERMGLRMTDKRIAMQLRRVLNPDGPLRLERGASRSVGLQILEALSNLRVRSPEADLMRLPLRRSSLDRLAQVILDRRLASIVGQEYELELKNPSEGSRSISLGDGGQMIEIGPRHFVIDGRKETVELLEAFRALGQTWTRVTRFGIDLDWVQPGRHPDYDHVLDVLILSLVVKKDAIESVGSWISGVVRQPFLRVRLAKVLRQCWRPPNLMTLSLVNLAGGTERLIRLIESSRGVSQLTCEGLLKRDAVFAGLIEFLEPFDAILKALDYGVEVARPE